MNIFLGFFARLFDDVLVRYPELWLTTIRDNSMALHGIRSSSEFDRVVSSLRSGNLSNSQILIDDGSFFIERNLGAGLEERGRLISRRPQDQKTPGVLQECGTYQSVEGGKWACDFPQGRDKPLFAPSQTREDAIALLWFSRSLA